MGGLAGLSIMSHTRHQQEPLCFAQARDVWILVKEGGERRRRRDDRKPCLTESATVYVTKRQEGEAWWWHCRSFCWVRDVRPLGTSTTASSKENFRHVYLVQEKR